MNESGDFRTLVELGCWLDYPPSSPSKYEGRAPVGTVGMILATLPADETGEPWRLLRARLDDGRTVYLPVALALLEPVTP